MGRIQELEKRRDEVLEHLRSIRSMKQGSINKQYFPATRGGKRTQELLGPYYVLSRKEGAKTVSRRLKGTELKQTQQDVEQYKRFMGLCKELGQLTIQLGEFERQAPYLEEKKKPRRSPSSRTGK